MFCCKEKINKKEVVRWGLLGGFAELVYIVLIALAMYFVGNKMDQQVLPILGFMTFLMLFVFSVGVSGLFVFGYPAYLVMQKRFHEAIVTALISLGVILGGFILAFISLNVI
jgi:hypothetical protein